MARREGFRWHRGTWQPNARQRAVLDLLVEGKSNAEIAVRLGITLDGAKWHVSELLAETRCEDRQALARWWRGEAGKAGRHGLPALLPFAWVARGLAAAAVGMATLAAVVALSGAGSDGPAGTPEAFATQAPVTWPTPWPDEGLEALAASHGPPPATCEPPEAQDLRLVDAAELTAQGLQPAGRILIDTHCPLYVANRIDRSIVWVGGGGVLALPADQGWRMANIIPCCSFSAVLNDTYYFRAENYPGPATPAALAETFDFVDSGTALIRPVHGEGVFLTLQASGREGGNLGRGPNHRLALASDGRLFVDPRPVDDDLVINDLTGENIDVASLGPATPFAITRGDVRTDCYTDGPCRVYLTGTPGAREGEVGPFNPSVMLAPFDGVLSCIAVEGEYWSIDGPALAYELSSGPLVLRIEALGGYWEEWENCQPRNVARGQELEVWLYTRIEAYLSGEPVSVVATADGRLYFGDVELELGCPCGARY